MVRTTSTSPATKSPSPLSSLASAPGSPTSFPASETLASSASGASSAEEASQFSISLQEVSATPIPLSNQAGKSKKLNPKRVGAAWAERRKREMEMEQRGEIVQSDYGANWLPNFGGVWQSGTRKEARKEFELEKHNSVKVESQSETTLRQQKDANKYR